LLIIHCTFLLCHQQIASMWTHQQIVWFVLHGSLFARENVNSLNCNELKSFLARGSMDIWFAMSSVHEPGGPGHNDFAHHRLQFQGSHEHEPSTFSPWNFFFILATLTLIIHQKVMLKCFDRALRFAASTRNKVRRMCRAYVWLIVMPLWHSQSPNLDSMVESIVLIILLHRQFGDVASNILMREKGGIIETKSKLDTKSTRKTRSVRISCDAHMLNVFPYLIKWE
jgi:hypothetical protein